MGPKDDALIREWLEAKRRVKREAKNLVGREALTGEWLVLKYNRKAALMAEVERFCASLNREWKRGQA